MIKKLKPIISMLEPRIVFDGAAINTAIDVIDHSILDNTDKNISENIESLEQKKEIIFINDDIENYKDLTNELKNQDKEVFIINSNKDGLTQVENIINFIGSIDAIHIIAHGSNSNINIGNTNINQDNLDYYKEQLESIGNQLSKDTDILLYGCNIAANEEQTNFIENIAKITKSDILSSDDITGINGDWNLEYSIGSIQTDSLIFSNYNFNLSSEVVPTANNDTYNLNKNTITSTDAISGLLANDSDDNNDTFHIKVNGQELSTDVNDPNFSTTFSTANGNITVNGDGSFSYTPNNDYVGSDSFTYTIIDNDGESNSATVNLNIIVKEYEENDGPTKLIGEDTTITIDADDYTNGYIDFEIDDQSSTEVLSFEKTNTASTIDGKVTVVGNSVFVGDGTEAISIGTIDSFYNGEDGKKLRVLLSVGFSNGSFDNSEAGWIIEDEPILLDGVYQIAGWPTPIDTTYPSQNSTNDELAEPRNGIGHSIEDGALRLNTGGATSASYGVIRGAYVYSDATVSLTAGATLSFDWRAIGSGDAYDSYGYLLDVNTGNTITILDETGSTMGETQWDTREITVDISGDYRFVFVAGSFDATGGTAVGGSLLIDNISVNQEIPISISNYHLEELVKLVTYEDTGDLTADNDNITKNIIITPSTKDTPTNTTQVEFTIQEINDDPIIDNITETLEDTIDTDTFLAINGNLTTQDADIGETFTYSFDDDYTGDKIGTYGKLNINADGSYTYTPDADHSIINALSTTVYDTFNIKVIDSAGASSTGTFTVEIIGNNDAPKITKVGDISSSTSGDDLIHTSSGPVEFTDIDTDDTHTASIDPNIVIEALDSVGNTITLTTTQENLVKDAFSVTLSGNQVDWEHSINKTDFSFLTAGQKIETTYIIVVTDQAGATATKEITATITGVVDDINDITIEYITKIIESEKLSDTGDSFLTIADTTHTYTESITLSQIIPLKSDNITPLTLTTTQQQNIINAFNITSKDTSSTDATVSWIYDITEDELNFLQKNETITAIFTITLTDDTTNAQTTQDVIIKIIGTNDTPTIENYTNTDDVNEDVLTGSISMSDVVANDIDSDNNNLEFIPFSEQVANIITTSTNIGIVKVSIDENGNYTITGDDIQKLSQGESAQISFDIQIKDDSGDTTTNTSEAKTITINIIGTNDNPIIETTDTTNLSGTILEGSILNDTGTLMLVDIDTNDNLVITHELKSINTSNNNTIQLDINDSKLDDIKNAFSLISSRQNGTIDWDYTISADKLEFLSQDEIITLIYTITVTDDTGTKDTKDIIITIKGINDSVNIQTADVSGTILEDSNLSSIGVITFSDIDYTNRPKATSEVKSINAFYEDKITKVTLPTTHLNNITSAFSVSNTNTNEITWKYNISEKNLDFLGEGEIITAIFTVTITDDAGAIDTRNITININGTNDTPQITTQESLDEVKQFGEKVINKDISFLFSDIDFTDTLKYEIENLPKGLSIDKNSGIISGIINQSGKFDIIITATDDEGQKVSKEYEMIVLAPPKEEMTNKPINIKPFKPIEVKEILIPKEPIINNTKPTKLETIKINTKIEEIKKDIYIQDDIEIKVNEYGQIDFSKDKMKNIDIIGFAIDKIKIDNDLKLKIKIVDTQKGQIYEVVQKDGKALPEGIKYNQYTGYIEGDVKNITKLSLIIKAKGADGKTRVLTIDLDIEKLSNKENFSSQIKEQNIKHSNYGDKFASLFN
jgi:VCBS repeat-containing protein